MAIKLQHLSKQLKVSERDLRALALEKLEVKIGPKQSDLTRELADKLREVVDQKKQEELEAEEAKKKDQEPEELKSIELPEIITVKEFASKLQVAVTNVMAILLKNGILANINEQIDFETATIIAEDLGYSPIPETKQNEPSDINLEEILAMETSKKGMKPRAPIVSVMGHVDHGKTKLLDFIRGTEVAEGEAGGITQKIGAYQIVHKDKNGKKQAITFLDTPGHEAFTSMRARGAKSTDIAILVVAADDGVKEQTIEAINHAKAAGIPIIVAINKMDKTGADAMKIKKDLADHDLTVEEWGGQTIAVELSAKTGDGVPELLEYILLTAEMSDLRANPDREAVGSVIEAHLHPSLGPVATVLVHAGTLHVGDSFWVGATYGKVRAMTNYKGERVNEAKPATPVMVSGFDDVPMAGDIVWVQETDKVARQKAEVVRLKRQKDGFRNSRFGLNEMTKQAKEGKLKEFKLVLKADSKGSLEAIKKSLDKLKTDKLSVNIIHSGTGNISSSDIMIASAGKAAVFGFNVRIVPQVLKQGENEGVDVRQFDVIYHLLETVEKVLSGMVEPEVVREEIGMLKVLEVFYSGKDDTVVGGIVTKGVIKPFTKAHIIRGEEIVMETELGSVQRGPEEVKEVAQNEECGLKLKTAIRMYPDDMIKVIEEKKTIV